MACLRGMANRGRLDTKCPNRKLHGGQWHPMDARGFTRNLHRQLVQNRNEGFEPLHIRGRTGYLLKATLLSHGYTVIIKATTEEKEHALIAEADSYHRLRTLQGHHIPVCLGSFVPNIEYWYHGEIIDAYDDPELVWNSSSANKQRKFSLLPRRAQSLPVHPPVTWSRPQRQRVA
ncbi:hypothetical protein BJX68DRAFT_242486 [Aspergillus pseudodeflectus]|uniref:Aminoglycoside phosphotransferase domain-containing protein n=1 Tax=Aspergillus pseudodeflectus TaxID=176178 RepID=A0ABR4K114_9EURO